MRHPPIPAPFLWYCWLASWLLGCLAALWFWQAAFCLALVLIFAISGRPASLFNATFRLGLGLAIFAMALTITRVDLAPPATIPDELPQTGENKIRSDRLSAHDLPHIQSDNIHSRFSQSGQNQTGKKATTKRLSPRLCATVHQVQSLPDQRLRVLLQDPILYEHTKKTNTGLPDEIGSRTKSQTMPGLIAWTWESPSFHPLPGQAICIRKSPKPLSGFANFDLPEWNISLKLQGVRWRLWSRGEDGGPVLADAGTKILAGLRLALVERVASLAGLPNLPEITAQSAHTIHPDQSMAILPALLFGERFWLTSQTVNKFAAASLAHSLALSGQHLAIAWLASAFLVAVLVRIWPDLYLTMPRTIISMLLACPLAGIYLWLGNAPWSLLRAGAMLAVMSACISTRRGHSLTDILAMALFCLLIVRPTAILETGLQLSVLCVSVIAVCLPWLRRLRSRMHAGPGRPWYCRLTFACLSILGISLAIQIFLLPVNILIFGNPGFYFILNLVWLPMLGLWLLPLACAGLVLACPGLFLANVWPFLAGWCDLASGFCLWLASLPSEFVLQLLDGLDRAGLLSVPACLRPHWTALPAFALLLLAMACLAACQMSGRLAWCQLPKRVLSARVILVMAIPLLATGPICRLWGRMSDDLRLDVLDVGLGQALVLRSQGGQKLVVDAGGSASPRFDPGQAVVAPSLLVDQGPELTAIINSHPDMDHAGGIFYLHEHFRTGILLHNGRQADGKRARDWARLLDLPGSASLAAGDRIILDHGHDFGLYSGPANTRDDGKNDHGISCGKPDQLVIEVLHPPRCAQVEQWSDNGASLVLRLVRNGKGLAILTGDADLAALRYLLAQSREHGQDLTAEVLVAPHHGSDKNFLPEFYQAVRPTLVLASCGANNRYNYPGKRLTAWLAQQGIPLLDTGRNGQIRITWQRNGRMTKDWERQR